MFGMGKCPRCGAGIGVLPRSFREWRSGKRQCPGCHAVLEISNPLLLGALGGLVAVGVIMLLRPLTRLLGGWIAYVFAVLLAWLVMWLFVCPLARWQVLSGGFQDSPAVRKWNRVSWFTFVVFIVAMFAIGAIQVVLHQQTQSTGMRGTDPVTSLERVMENIRLSIVLCWASIGICACEMGVTVWAFLMKQKARKAEIGGPPQSSSAVVSNSTSQPFDAGQTGELAKGPIDQSAA